MAQDSTRRWQTLSFLRVSSLLPPSLPPINSGRQLGADSVAARRKAEEEEDQGALGLDVH